MGIGITKQEIVSASEVVRNFSKIRTEVKENSRMIVFKNNKPDLVLLDFSEYEKLLELLKKQKKFPNLVDISQKQN